MLFSASKLSFDVTKILLEFVDENPVGGKLLPEKVDKLFLIFCDFAIDI